MSYILVFQKYISGIHVAGWKKTVSLVAISQKKSKGEGPVKLASRSAGEWRFEIVAMADKSESLG